MKVGNHPTADAQKQDDLEFAKGIRERREAEGMKQVTLAALAGVTERTVQRLEAGQKMDDRTVQSIAKVLGLEKRSLSGSPTSAASDVSRERKSMMKNYFVTMTRFDRWANGRLLDWMESRPEDPNLAHVYAHLLAENLPWLHLLRGESVPNDLNPEPEWSLAECRNHFEPTMDALASYVAGLEEGEFENVVRSHSPAGHVFENTVLEVLTNLFAHAEHHRGQLVSDIMESTGEYVPTLYMSYLRCQAN